MIGESMRLRTTLGGFLLAVGTLLALIPATTASAAPGAGIAATPTCVQVRYFYQGADVPAVSRTGSVNCNMVRGNVSPAVEQLQLSLNRCSPDSLRRAGVYPLSLDGNFGGNTEKGLRYAQADHGTGADGVYGPATRKAISHFDSNGEGCLRVT
ncbi:putative peptidoglycan binding protein [Micromonospora pisi]|uniref:Putative peptidoglycan binding protein n=1 Tax=Micromonospora pisi TaxID=589240 RepID=A0A495JR49_9ACTN|nr:peptidoglycan-binding domain-containing protein [Micromonospora pisi]RKR91456.1 putative peptidoglycan binding protein [Micromonospora pisi]